MAVEHVKSTPVSNLDATPVVPNTSGEGGGDYVRSIEGFVTVPASSSIDSTFRFVRVPTNCVIKRVLQSSAAQTDGSWDVGVYYPTTGRTGLPDLAANAIDQDFFASAVASDAATAYTDITYEAGAGNLRAEANTPLWSALGLTSDPGGFFDIVATVTEAVTTGAGVLLLKVEYAV